MPSGLIVSRIRRTWLMASIMAFGRAKELVGKTIRFW
jgi:hypothetical protein